METLKVIGLVLAIVSPIASAVWVVATVRTEVLSLRRDVDRHEQYFTESRKVSVAR